MGRVEAYLLDKIDREGCIHVTLLDPEKMSSTMAANVAAEAEAGGTAAVMVGGSTLASNQDLDAAVMAIKDHVRLPVILFPNNIVGVSKYADAIWFMSLLNSCSTYYIIEAQALSSPLVKRYALEAIPMGYIIVGEGCAAGYVGNARPIGYKYPEIAASYALAGSLLGMRFMYLEAGSGADQPIPPEMISKVKRLIDVPLIVGGGIRDGSAAEIAAKAGADILVTGNIVEDVGSVKERVWEIVQRIRSTRGALREA